ARGLAAVLGAALMVRLALAPLYAHLPGGFHDEDFWKFWMRRIHEDGVLNIFRATDTDYVGYHWMLWLLSLAYSGRGYSNTDPWLHLLVKAPSIGFDLVLIAAVSFTTSALVRERSAANEEAPPGRERAYGRWLTAA